MSYLDKMASIKVPWKEISPLSAHLIARETEKELQYLNSETYITNNQKFIIILIVNFIAFKIFLYLLQISSQKHMSSKLILILQICAISCFSLYGRIDISNKTGAACMDGSSPAFYLWQPEPEDVPVNKVLIYFDQTPFGWCVEQDLSTSIQRCFKFMNQSNLKDTTSTNDWPNDLMPLSGILSPFDGGAFNMWTKVLIRSCDAGAYMGNRQSISYKKRLMHFKGSINVQQVFKHLQSKKLLTNREQIVLSGSLNGAVAAMNYYQTLKQYTTAPIRLLLDSAIHLNQMNRKNNRSQFQNRMKMVQKLFLNDANPPSKICSAANQGESWKCLFGVQLQKHIPAPIFYSQSLYDGWSIDAILGFKCAQEFGSISECQQWQRQIIKEYHKNVTQVLKNITSKQGNGAFGISCIAHEFVKGRWNNQQFQIPMNSGNIMMNVTGHWIKTKNSTVYIDKVDWPENKPCARKLIKKSKNLATQ